MKNEILQKYWKNLVQLKSTPYKCTMCNFSRQDAFKIWSSLGLKLHF